MFVTVKSRQFVSSFFAILLAVVEKQKKIRFSGNHLFKMYRSPYLLRSAAFVTSAVSPSESPFFLHDGNHTNNKVESEQASAFALDISPLTGEGARIQQNELRCVSSDIFAVRCTVCSMYFRSFTSWYNSGGILLKACHRCRFTGSHFAYQT